MVGSRKRGGTQWGALGGGNGLEAAAVTPPPGLFTRCAFGNPNDPFTPFLSQLPGRSGISIVSREKIVL